jgi:hypothetical protein
MPKMGHFDPEKARKLNLTQAYSAEGALLYIQFLFFVIYVASNNWFNFFGLFRNNNEISFHGVLSSSFFVSGINADLVYENFESQYAQRAKTHTLMLSLL